MDELPTFLGAGNFFCSYINSDEDDTTSQNINYGKLMGGNISLWEASDFEIFDKIRMILP